MTERVTDDFLKYTYNRLKEIDSKQMCVEPWPPKKSVSSDGTKLVRIFLNTKRHLMSNLIVFMKPFTFLIAL